MASIINIPFNFQPSTPPSRKTSSYTVPTGKYAKAILSFYAPRIQTVSIGQSYPQNTYTITAPNWITINANNVLQEKNQVVNFNWSWGSDGTGTISTASGLSGQMAVSFYVNAATNTSPTLTGINGFSLPYGLQNTRVLNTYCNGGTTTISLNSNGSGGTPRTSNGSFNVTIFNANVPDSVEVWLKAGDVISASGGNWQAVVTEYTVVS